MSDKIAAGKRVVIHFTLSMADGTPVESSGDGEPMAFVVGDGTLEVALERLILGLGAGDRARFHLPPGQAFGELDPANVHTMARTDFPPEMELEAGTVVGFGTPAGHEVAGTVVAVDEDSVEVDFNHPLAGRELIFEVEVVSVADEPD